MIPILLGITLVTFFLFHVAGGDPAAQIAGKYATAEQVENIRKQIGVSGTLQEQFFGHLKQVITFDFGRSWNSGRLVVDMIFGNSLDTSPILNSLSLTLPAFVITIVIAIFIALVLVFRRGTLFDKTLMTISLAAISISSLVYIVFLQFYLGYRWDIFPFRGWDSSWFYRWHFLQLPILIFVLLSLGSNILFYRTVFMDELFQDYVRTAKAKGLSNKVIMFKHILRNALIPIVTLVVMQVPFLLMGTLLLESFFQIPGVGSLIYTAIQEGDFPVIKAVTFISALLYMFFQLFSDLLYAVVDPKIQLR